MAIFEKVFTPEEVDSLNAYQQSGAFHPFTCGGECSDKRAFGEEASVLIATEEGWKCYQCDYVQNWSHEWMKDWTWKRGPEAIINHGKK